MLEASDIQLNYGKKQVLKQVSFHASKGECIGILGTNGCGKSTLLKILAGVLSPTKGTIFYEGKDACQNPKLFSRYAGYVPQDNPLIEELSVLDNLKLWYTAGSLNIEQELTHGVLHMLDLDTVLKKKVHTLSGGMKKRLSIGCALASRPQVLILDEPSASLDLPCKEDIRSYLRRFTDQDGTVILTTHEEPELALCNRLFAIKDGILEAIPTDARGHRLRNLLMESLQDTP